jgi:D-alanyl-D-alanine carboxypeptidase
VTARTRNEVQRTAAADEPVPLPPDRPQAVPDATASIPSPVGIAAYAPVARPGSTDPIKPRLVKTVSVKPAGKTPKRATTAFASPAPPPAPAAEAPQPRPAQVAAAKPEPAKPAARKAAPEKPARSGWMIQVGAFGDEKEARERLSAVQSRVKTLLSGADPFTESVTKGDKTLYRARFAGLDKSQAEAACRTLKRSDIACLALKN